MIKIYFTIFIYLLFIISCSKNNKKEISKNNIHIDFIVNKNIYGSNVFQLKSNNETYTVLITRFGVETGYIYLINNSKIILDSFLINPGYFNSFHRINPSSLYFGISQTARSPSFCYIMEVLNNKIHFSYGLHGDHYEHHACIEERGEDSSKSWISQSKNSLINIDTFGSFNKIKTLDVSVSQECTEKIWRNILIESFIYDTVEHIYYTKKITSEISLDTSSSRNTKKEKILKINGTFSIIEYETGSYKLFYKSRWYYKGEKDSILKVSDHNRFKSYVPKYK